MSEPVIQRARAGKEQQRAGGVWSIRRGVCVLGMTLGEEGQGDQSRFPPCSSCKGPWGRHIHVCVRPPS